MAVRQYIGARYVPIFGRPGEESIQWDNTKPYEPLTVVLYQGNSYTSRQFVPVGIEITNEAFWAETGNYNAQVEQYRQEVMTFDGAIGTNTDDIDTLKGQLAGTEPSALKSSIDTNTGNIGTHTSQLAGTEPSALKTSIDANADNISTHTSQLAGTEPSALKTSIDANADNISTMQEDLQALSDLVTAEDELIWIGDSWSRNFSGIIPNSVAQILGMQLHTYAVSGTGWFSGTTTFVQQAQQAIADNTVNPEKVKLIIIYGGTNDFYHGSDSGSAYQNVVSTTCASLKAAFPHATIHHFFNTCYKHGTTTYPKLNEQIKCWKDVSYYANDSKACVAHAESAYWMINPNAFQDDLLHPVENASKRLAGHIAKSVSGCTVEGNRALDVKQIALASSDNTVTGTAYVTAKDEKIKIYAYVTVNEDLTQTRGIGTAVGMIPFDIMTNAATGDVHNHIAMPMGKNAAMGMAMLDVQLNTTSAGGDVIYIGQPNGSGAVSAGSYNGFGEFVMFV